MLTERTCKRTDLSPTARCAVLRSNLEKTVGINLEGGDKLGLSTGHGRDAVELELAEKTVVAALCALALVASIARK